MTAQSKPEIDKLVKQCKQNQHYAQMQIYKLYYKAMYNTCLRIVKNPTTAEDIMQEGFLSAFQNINSYKGEVSFGAWLKKIIINKSLDEIKRKKPDLVFEEPLENTYLTEEITDNENGIKSRQVEMIKNAIAELPDGYRIILSLYLLEGYDHEEISDILKISSSTSRSQYTRAKQKLLKILEITHE